MAKKRKRGHHIKKQGLRKRLEVMVTIFALIGVSGFTGVYTFLKNEVYDVFFSSVKISESECLPYWGIETEDGYQENLMSYQTTNLDLRRAFCISTFFENPKDKPIRLESVSTEIIRLEPVEDENLIFDLFINNHTVKAFAVNNGWSDIEITNPKIVARTYDGNQHFTEYPMSIISDEIFLADHIELRPGDVEQIAEYQFDLEKLQDFYAGESWLTTRQNDILVDVLAIDYHIEIHCDVGDFSCTYWINYLPEADTFILETPGMSSEEDPPCSATLFSVLDVTKAQTLLNERESPYLRYTNPAATPQIDETYHISTVIAPTKSCYIECRNVFRFGKKSFKTDPIRVTVNVPVFLENEEFNPYSMIREILPLQRGVDSQQIDKIVAKYRYNANNFNQ